MKDRDRQALLDIINSANLTEQYLNGKTKTNFEKDLMLQDAIVRRLEIVGEAATRLSDEARQTLSHIPWQQIIGMRNIMIHQYDTIASIYNLFGRQPLRFCPNLPATSHPTFNGN